MSSDEQLVVLSYRPMHIASKMVRPIRIWFGVTDQYPQRQWLMDVYDHSENAHVVIALCDIIGFGPPRDQEGDVTVNEVYEVIWVDRHAGTEVQVFADEDTAIEWAKAQAREYGAPEDLDEERTDLMIRAGWLYYGRYSGEGDYLRVVKREIRQT